MLQACGCWPPSDKYRHVMCMCFHQIYMLRSAVLLRNQQVVLLRLDETTLATENTTAHVRSRPTQSRDGEPPHHLCRAGEERRRKYVVEEQQVHPHRAVVVCGLDLGTLGLGFSSSFRVSTTSLLFCIHCTSTVRHFYSCTATVTIEQDGDQSIAN